MRRMILLMMICLTAVFALPGCRTSTKTTERETRTTYVDEDAANDNIVVDADATQQLSEVERTQTTSEHRGVLGTTIHAIGQVLAFPFKLVAGIIEFIF